MNQFERRRFLIDTLLEEQPEYKNRIRIPGAEKEQKKLLRSLMNIRWAAPITKEFEKIQDEYLKEENARRGIVRIEELTPVQETAP